MTINKHSVSSPSAGEESGGFSFTVTDGEHTSPLYQFVITARPLTITMVTQEELMVFPGTNCQILSHEVMNAWSLDALKPTEEA